MDPTPVIRGAVPADVDRDPYLVAAEREVSALVPALRDPAFVALERPTGIGRRLALRLAHVVGWPRAEGRRMASHRVLITAIMSLAVVGLVAVVRPTLDCDAPSAWSAVRECMLGIGRAEVPPPPASPSDYVHTAVEHFRGERIVWMRVPLGTAAPTTDLWLSTGMIPEASGVPAVVYFGAVDRFWTDGAASDETIARAVGTAPGGQPFRLYNRIGPIALVNDARVDLRGGSPYHFDRPVSTSVRALLTIATGAHVRLALMAGDEAGIEGPPRSESIALDARAQSALREALAALAPPGSSRRIPSARQRR